MRITFVLPGYPAPIGGFRVVYEYANQLVARGHELTVIHARHLRNVDPAPNFYRWLRRKTGNLLTRVSKPNLRWLPIDRRIKMLFVREPTYQSIPDSDIVVATAWQISEYVAGYPPQKGKKYYMVMDFGPWFGPKDRIRDSWKLPLRKITISAHILDKVIASTGTRTDVINIPCAVAHSRFHRINDVSNRPMQIAMMYSRAKYKGADDGIQALEISRSKHPGVRATVFGKGRRPRLLPRWIEYRTNIPEAELVHLYNEARIFICSSLAEGFALPPAEAMACGCAVVSTDCGGNREYAEHDVTALLSPPGDPKALAGNVLRLLEDDNLRIRLAEAGHKRIQEFTWEHNTDLLEGFMTKTGT